MNSKVKTTIPRHPIERRKRSEGNAIIRSIGSEYDVRSSEATLKFIAGHPKVSAALLALTAHIEDHFGRSMPTLEAITDPEESSKKLRVKIETSFPPMKAMQALDSVERSWLPGLHAPTGNLFVLTVAPQ